MGDMPEYVTVPVVEQAREPFDGANGVDSSGNWIKVDFEKALWQWDVSAVAFNFCGCGSPEVVEDAVLAYLEGVVDLDEEANVDVSLQEREARCGGDVAYLLLAYLADQQGWTDHGSSVYGAWITDKGRQTKLALERAKQTRGK